MRSTLLLLGVALMSGISSMAADAPRATATLAMDGRLHVTDGKNDLCSFNPVAASPSWQFAQPKATSLKQTGDSRTYTIKSGQTTISGQATAKTVNGAVESKWTFTSDSDADLNALAVTVDFEAKTLAGGTWTADDKSGSFPKEFGPVRLFSADIRKLVATTADSKTFSLSFPKPTTVLLQDNRQWGQTISFRIGRQTTKFAKGETFELPMTLALTGGLMADLAGPTIIRAGNEWVPLKTELDIEPGSALDFSTFGFADGPCGKNGRVIVSKDGHFAFENSPATPRRFYGVNLCFTAHYLPHDKMDQLCDRLVRLGYNTLRIHHYERTLSGGKPTLEWDNAAIDQLDYLLAACRKRGIYVTTDLYVSRPVPAEYMAASKEWSSFKVMIPVDEGAFKNWEDFSRKLLDRVNPHTGLRWADDPTLAWLSMINEGNIGNYWKDVKTIPQWKTAWNKWLASRYGSREKLAESWGNVLKEGEDPATGTVALPDGVYGSTPRDRDNTLFLAETESAMFTRMAKFLREEIKCKALLTNMNAWTNHVPNQMTRSLYDYVDDHFYVDHPQFIEKSWSLPSRCSNENPVKQGAPGGRGGNLVRLLGKPFTVSEYNYSGPGRFRGVGGILTGAMAAIQDWDVIWRFAYSHTDKNLFTPSTMGYFDLVTDPLNQAADRAAIMLYLRQDMKPAAHEVAVVVKPEDLGKLPTKVPTITDGPRWLTWVTKVGSFYADGKSQLSAQAMQLPTGWSDKADLKAFGTPTASLVKELKTRNVIAADNPTNPDTNVFKVETSEMTIDGPKGLMVFDTARTAGGYADPGQQIAAGNAGVEAKDFSIGSTVFVTSLDGKPIRESSRLLVTHLTDLQNTECTYAEPARQILLSWGKLPHLVRNGTATVSVAVPAGANYNVFGLATSGRRTGEVPCQVAGGKLTFACDVNGPDGARMMYEIVKR